MPAVSKKVPALFESTIVSAELPVLSSQYDLPATLIPNALSFQAKLSPVPIRSKEAVYLAHAKRKKSVRFEHPKMRISRGATPATSYGSSGDDDSDSESVTSISSLSSDSSMEDGKIQKPEGEAGRPGRGGYNLERAINWQAQEYKRLKAGYLLLLFTPVLYLI